MDPKKKEVNNGSYLVNDLIQGDETVSRRSDFSELTGEQIQQSIDIILNRSDVTYAQKQMLLSNMWRIHYKTKPPTIEEFLTEKYIGPTANSLYPHVKGLLCEFWQPDSAYRNLILGSAIGTGKALPVSSPVVVEEVRTKVIELEDGTKLTFDYGEEVWYYDQSNSLKTVLVEKLEEVEVKDFPVPLNYYTMQLYNAKKVQEFQEAFPIDSYEPLIEFFKKFPDEFFHERNIYCEDHHIVPRCEGGNEEKENLVRLPYFFHVKAHYLRAKEWEKEGQKRKALQNYYSVQRSLSTECLPEEEKKVFSKIQFVSEALEKKNTLQSKQFFVKKEGEASIKIFEEEWEEYASLGWERGRDFKDPSNKKWVNKNGKNFYVPKEEYKDFLDLGYSPGMHVTEKMKEANPSRASYSTQGTKWVNKAGKRKCIKKEEVETYLKKGWSLGSGSKTVSGQTWKWKEDNLGRHKFTDGEQEIWAKECPKGFVPVEFHLSGKKQYHNGERFIFADECPEGWLPGRPPSKKKWYTNDIEEVFSDTCPEGWKIGKLKGKKNWYTNGEESKQLEVCPDGWWKGRAIK